MAKKKQVIEDTSNRVMLRAIADSRITLRKYAEYHRHSSQLSPNAADRTVQQCTKELATRYDFFLANGTALSVSQLQCKVRSLFLEWYGNQRTPMASRSGELKATAVKRKASAGLSKAKTATSKKATPTVATTQKGSLKGLTTAMKEYLDTRTSTSFHMDDLERATGAKRRRILEVVHVLEGIGILERQPLTPQGIQCFRWAATPPAAVVRAEPATALELEERRLDAWIDMVQRQNEALREENPLYVCAETLKRGLYKYQSTPTDNKHCKMVAVAVSPDDTWFTSSQHNQEECLESRSLSINAPVNMYGGGWGVASAPEAFELNGPHAPIRYHALEESRRALRTSTWCSDLLMSVAHSTTLGHSPSLTCVSEDDDHEHGPEELSLNSTTADKNKKMDDDDKGLLPLLLQAISCSQ